MKTPTLYSSRNLDILSYCIIDVVLPLISGISAGFPSPAADFIDTSIDLGKELIRNPSSTFLARVKGNSMKDIGIHDGDLMIIDKSLDCKKGMIAVCFLDGEFTVKRVRLEKNECWLIAENQNYKPIRVTADNEFLVWGIVTRVVKYFDYVRTR